MENKDDNWRVTVVVEEDIKRQKDDTERELGISLTSIRLSDLPKEQVRAIVGEISTDLRRLFVLQKPDGRFVEFRGVGPVLK